MNHAHGLQCERARQWISFRADGELSHFEGFALAAHLRRCAACHAFAQTVDTMTAGLRETPLEQPVETIEMPSRRRLGVARVLNLGSAAAVAVAFIAAAATGRVGILVPGAGTHSLPAKTTMVGRQSASAFGQSGSANRPEPFLGRLKAE